MFYNKLLFSRLPSKLNTLPRQQFVTRFKVNMSFSNTSTGAQAADPYTAKNADEPGTKEKIDSLSAFAEKCKLCMLTTSTPENKLLVSRAMAMAGKEGNGVDMIFHANTESGKTDDLKSDPKCNLSFLNPSGEWASISGEASVDTDRASVHKYYSPILKAWVGDLGDGKHDGGPDDPRICVIRVKAITAQLSLSNRGLIGSAFDVAKGAVTGETASIHKLRHIEEAELKAYRAGTGN